MQHRKIADTNDDGLHTLPTTTIVLYLSPLLPLSLFAFASPSHPLSLSSPTLTYTDNYDDETFRHSGLPISRKRYCASVSLQSEEALTHFLLWRHSIKVSYKLHLATSTAAASEVVPIS